MLVLMVSLTSLFCLPCYVVIWQIGCSVIRSGADLRDRWTTLIGDVVAVDEII